MRRRRHADGSPITESELRRGLRRIARDVLVVAAILGAGGTALAVWYSTSHHALRNGRPLGGPQVDVSRAPLVQSEATIAIDPADPRLMLAGSNDQLFVTRVYTSRDGGRRWRSLGGPPLAGRAQCGFGDPAIAIAEDGREYYAFLANLSCNQPEFRSHLFVSARPRFGSEWHSYPVARPGGGRFIWDDKPAIAVGDNTRGPHRGRVYLAWSRRLSGRAEALETSFSDDGGRAWATPVPVGEGRFVPLSSSVAVGPGGGVYVVATDPFEGLLWAAESTDGGARFGRLRVIAATAPRYSTSCSESAFPIPAQAARCVNANPVVNVVTRGREAGDVVVTYESSKANGTQGVYAEGFDPELRRRFRVRVTPSDREPADQFLPVSAIDPANGDLWACFYDTTGDSARTHAWYTCTVSRDGGRTWSMPVRAASVPSDETHGGYLQYGDYEGVAADDGVAHPIWTDTRDEPVRAEEVFTTAIRAASLR